MDRQEAEIDIYKVLMLMAILVIISGLKLASDVLTPLLLSLFLAIVSASYIGYFIRKGVTRIIAWIYTPDRSMFVGLDEHNKVCDLSHYVQIEDGA